MFVLGDYSSYCCSYGAFAVALPLIHPARAKPHLSPERDESASAALGRIHAEVEFAEVGSSIGVYNGTWGYVSPMRIIVRIMPPNTKIIPLHCRGIFHVGCGGEARPSMRRSQATTSKKGLLGASKRYVKAQTI